MSDDAKHIRELRQAYLDGHVAQYGVYGDEAEWKCLSHIYAENVRKYWEERAALRYPLPTVTVPRVVRVECFDYRVVDGVVEYACAGDDDWEPYEWDVQSAIANLLANPTETREVTE
jgi:hypothetical protein